MKPGTRSWSNVSNIYRNYDTLRIFISEYTSTAELHFRLAQHQTEFRCHDRMKCDIMDNKEEYKRHIALIQWNSLSLVLSFAQALEITNKWLFPPIQNSISICFMRAWHSSVSSGHFYVSIKLFNKRYRRRFSGNLSLFLSVCLWLFTKWNVCWTTTFICMVPFGSVCVYASVCVREQFNGTMASIFWTKVYDFDANWKFDSIGTMEASSWHQKWSCWLSDSFTQFTFIPLNFLI